MVVGSNLIMYVGSNLIMCVGSNLMLCYVMLCGEYHSISDDVDCPHGLFIQIAAEHIQPPWFMRDILLFFV